MAEAFETLNLDGDRRFLIVCDHASNYIPPEYNCLGLDEEVLNQHIAYDLGAADVTRELAQKLECPAILSNFSRLIIDPNRGLDDPTLVVKLSDGEIIPGNYHVDRFRGSEQLTDRVSRYYKPYNDAIASHLAAVQADGIIPIILSVHSFTPIWRGEPRPWHGAILWDRDDRLRNKMLAYFDDRPEIIFGDNEPYSGRLENDCMYRHATRLGLAHGLIEIRQDIATDTVQRKDWVGYLSDILSAAVEDEDLTRIQYFGSMSD